MQTFLDFVNLLLSQRRVRHWPVEDWSRVEGRAHLLVLVYRNCVDEIGLLVHLSGVQLSVVETSIVEMSVGETVRARQAAVLCRMGLQKLGRRGQEAFWGVFKLR